MVLMTMEKKAIESFKEYAHRWRDIASQVQPSLMKKETAFIFVNTIPEPYYEMMIWNAMRNFMEIVWLWELIKHGIKNKKIERKSTLTPSAKKNIPSRKKREIPMLFLPISNPYGKFSMLTNLPMPQITFHPPLSYNSASTVLPTPTQTSNSGNS